MALRGGCTAQCRTDADCPRRLTIEDASGMIYRLPPYTCQSISGVNLCIAPIVALGMGGDIVGYEALGTTCSTGDVCYSGGCDTDVRMCVQTCTPNGGCPPGFGCSVEDTGSGRSTYMVCRPTGSSPIGASCTRPQDCASSLCWGLPGSGYCSRFCNGDRLCPTGMTCTALGTSIDGNSYSLCTR